MEKKYVHIGEQENSPGLSNANPDDVTVVAIYGEEVHTSSWR
jgi:hypothetical protein